jgi:tetratricopeptide (TPR) repeat protein
VGRIDDAIRLGRAAVATIREWRDAGSSVNALTNLGLALGAGGFYDEAISTFAEAQRFARDYELRTMLARAAACSTGVHLDIFDYPGAEAHALAAYETARSIWLPCLVSARIDLLFTYVRSGEVGRAEALVDEVIRLSELPGSFHDWLWRIRVVEARAELALAQGRQEEALRLVNQSLRQSLRSRRRKYVVIGLGTRAQALAAAGRGKEAIRDLNRAVALARAMGDPAQFLRAAALLLPLAGDDLLAAEARATVERMASALPDETLRRRFREAEPVRSLGRW